MRQPVDPSVLQGPYSITVAMQVAWILQKHNSRKAAISELEMEIEDWLARKMLVVFNV